MATTLKTKLELITNVKGHKQVRSLNKEISKLGMVAKNPSKGGDGIKKIADDAERSSKKVKKSIAGIRSSINKLGDTKLFKGLSLSNAIGIAGLTAGAYSLARAASQGVSEFRDYQVALKEIETIAGDVTEEMDTMFKAFASSYGKDATEQAKAYYQIVSAGVEKGAAAMRTLDAANKVALGGIADIGSSINIVTTILNIYKDENLSAADAVDSLFTAVKLGKTTIPELASTLGGVLPQAAALGISLDEVTASMAYLTAQGLSTGQAATSLASLLRALQLKSKDLGEGFSTAELRAKSLKQILEELAKKQQTSGKEFINLLGRAEAANGAIILTKNNVEGLSNNLDQFAEKSGAASAAADKMKSSLDFKIEAMAQEFKNLRMEIGERLSPVIELMIGKFRTLLAITNDVFNVTTKDLQDDLTSINLSIGDLTQKLVSAKKELATLGDGIFASFSRNALQKDISRYESMIENLKKQREELDKKLRAKFSENKGKKNTSVAPVASVEVSSGDKANKDIDRMEALVKRLNIETLRAQGKSYIDFRKDQLEKELESILAVVKDPKIREQAKISFKFKADQESLADLKNQLQSEIDKITDIDVGKIDELSDKLIQMSGNSRKNLDSIRGLLKGVIEANSNVEGIDLLQGKVDEIGLRIGETKRNAKDLTDKVLSSAQGEFEDFFVGITSGTESVKESFKNLTKSIIKDLQRMAIKAALTRIFSGIMGKSEGGIVGYATGGVVQGLGSGTSDSVSARLSRGEYVMTKRSVDYYGAKFFDRLNKAMVPKKKFNFAEGGLVGESSLMASHPGGGGDVIVNNYGTPKKATAKKRTDNVTKKIITEVFLEDIEEGGKMSRAINKVTSTVRRA